MKIPIYIAMMILLAALCAVLFGAGCGKADRPGPDGGSDAGCRFDSECGDDRRCNPDTRECEPYPDTCVGDEDCQPRYCNLYIHSA